MKIILVLIILGLILISFPRKTGASGADWANFTILEGVTYKKDKLPMLAKNIFKKKELVGLCITR